MSKKSYVHSGKAYQPKLITISCSSDGIRAEILVEGQSVGINSALNKGDKEYEEWMEALPQLLVDEYNVNIFDVSFYGAQPDYNYLQVVAQEAKKSENPIILNIKHVDFEQKHSRGENGMTKKPNQAFEQDMQQGCPVAIKYNRYTLETEVKINGQLVEPSSELNRNGRKYEEWIEYLPQLLVDECHVHRFELSFCGRLADYNCLVTVAQKEKARTNPIIINLKYTNLTYGASKEPLRTRLDDAPAEHYQAPTKEVEQVKKISIRYNADTIETEITIDGQPVQTTSKLNKHGERYQSWVEDLPQLLVDECHIREFEVSFYGTRLDYEYLLAVAQGAGKRREPIILHTKYGDGDKNQGAGQAQNPKQQHQAPKKNGKSKQQHQAPKKNGKSGKAAGKAVFIKYNPYKLATEVKINGRDVKENSKMNRKNERFQAWVEDLPQILVDECNVKTFDIEFQGTTLDYEDLLEVAKDAADGEEPIILNCTHKPTKNTVQDKEKAIVALFKEIQQGPLPELREPAMLETFKKAMNSECKVGVIANVSSGKSTLLNAFLGKKLLMMKSKTCTQGITQIKDNNSKTFSAKVYYKNNSDDLDNAEPNETYSDFTYKTMEHCNENKDVSVIKVEGDIPFITSTDMTLVLVDTPGPNSTNDQHKEIIDNMLKESSEDVILYVMNASQEGSMAEEVLINQVIDSVNASGKQAKDRFIFVVNKVDTLRQGEDNVEDTLETVRKELHEKGIVKPNVYPVAARPALSIRMKQNDDPDIKEDLDEVEMEVKKLNRGGMLDLEKYAPLRSVRKKAETMVEEAKANGNSEGEALIHSGIISLEYAIRTYVQKYAKTAKIKELVDSFQSKFESTRCFEQTKKAIINNEGRKERLGEKIKAVQTKVNSAEEAKKFRQIIDELNLNEAMKKNINQIIMKGQAEVRQQIEPISGKLSREEAEKIYVNFVQFTEELEMKIKVKLEDTVNQGIEQTKQQLLNQYRLKISNLSGELNVGEISIDALKIMDGDIGCIGRRGDSENVVSNLIRTEQVKIGEIEEKNRKKKWYKVWTWAAPKVFVKEIYGEKAYVNGSELVNGFSSVENALHEVGSRVQKDVEEKTKLIKADFVEKFAELDKVLDRKLKELKACTSNREGIETEIQELQNNLDWMTGIKKKLEDILEI